MRATLAALEPATIDVDGARRGERQHARRARRRGAGAEVAVIGGGITGCAAAALLAEAGASVTLYEREEIAAGASGRNSGFLQHPMDPLLVPLYEASLELYEELGHGFALPGRADRAAWSAPTRALAADCAPPRPRSRSSRPEWLEGAALQAAEPALARRPVRLPAAHRPPGAAGRPRPARGRSGPASAGARSW